MKPQRLPTAGRRVDIRSVDLTGMTGLKQISQATYQDFEPYVAQGLG